MLHHDWYQIGQVEGRVGDQDVHISMGQRQWYSQRILFQGNASTLDFSDTLATCCPAIESGAIVGPV